MSAICREADRLTSLDGIIARVPSNASAQFFSGEAGGTRFVWIADLLPDDLAGRIKAPELARGIVQWVGRLLRPIRSERCGFVTGQVIYFDGGLSVSALHGAM